MTNFSDKIEIRPDVSKLKSILGSKVGIGTKVKKCMDTDGYHILKALLTNHVHKVKTERHKTFEQYNSKMDSVDLVQGLIEEFEGFVADANQAQSELEEVIKNTEDLTFSTLSLDGEGSDDEESQS